MIRTADSYSACTEQTLRTLIYRRHWEMFNAGVAALREAVKDFTWLRALPGPMSSVLSYKAHAHGDFAAQMAALARGYDFVADIGNIGYRPYGLRILVRRNFIVRRHHSADPSPSFTVFRMQGYNHDVVLYVR